MKTRQDYIDHIMQLKTGTEKCTPQIDYARWALAHYNELLPHFNLNVGVRDAMKAEK